MLSPVRRAGALSRRIVAVLLVVLLGALAVVPEPAVLAAPGRGTGTVSAVRAARATDGHWGAVPLARLRRGTAPGPRLASGLQRTLDRLPGTARVGLHPGTGMVRFLGGTAAAPLATPRDLRAGSSAVADALAATGPTMTRTADALGRAFLARVGPAFGIDDPRDLRTEGVETSAAGTRIGVRYQQLRRGIPVLGGELRVTLDRRGAITAASGEVLPAGDPVPLAARITAPAARAIAATWLAKDAGTTTAAVTTTSEGRVIVDPRILGSGGPRSPRLAWAIDARTPASRTDAIPDHRLVLVDARTGGILETLERVATGLDRTICDFHNRRRKDFRCTPSRVTRREGQRATGRAQVDRLYALLARYHAFWQDRFGRDGLDGHGQGYVATVRYCLLTWCPMQNAFWEWGPQQVAFGDGWATVDDFVGHEFTHGVLDHEARLFYDYQSGALNESFADIFGEGFDQLDQVGDDRPGVAWLLGEDLRSGAVRSMADPTRFGDPDRVRSPRWWSSPSDNGGVHSNSGVGNKTAYLIAKGGSFNGERIKGLGLLTMLRIEEQAMTARLTSASDYLDLHDALYQSCLDLVGTVGVTLGDCRSVRDATDATQLGLLPFVNGPHQAAVCRAGRYPVNVFYDDLEDPGAGRWVAGVIRGDPNPWHYPQNPNPRPDWDGTWASSGDTNLFGQDLGQANDAFIGLADAVTLPAGAWLRFEHGYRFDSGSRDFDGGVLEISVDGGAWQDLGGHIVESGYTGRLATGTGNPLGGRRAWVGVSRGWGASRVDLSPFAGSAVRIRFRIAADRNGAAAGWYLDDIRIYRCATDTDLPTASLQIGSGASTVATAQQTLTIAASDPTTPVTRMRVSNRGTVAGGLLVDGADLPFATTLDWLLTDTAWGGTTADGPKTVWLQVRDRAGNWSVPVSASVTLSP
ncbi:MAG: M4 family metallopeptidase [Chloroflexota bacterium]